MTQIPIGIMADLLTRIVGGPGVMNDSTLRIAVGGLVAVSALCIIGMVASSVFGKSEAVAVSLAGLAGTCVGGLVGILVPTGRIPPNGVHQPGPGVVSFQPPHEPVQHNDDRS